jgi:hypothetical protein
MGHLAIVNSATIQKISDSHPYISFGGKLKELPLKTISDLFADALAVRDGDYIFTWMINGGLSPGVGFDRFYIASGSVMFDPSDCYPIKVGVREGFKFDTAIPEEVALDIFRPNLLWNAIGKKSLGRGRSLSHQTLDEDNLLMSLLNSKNNLIAPHKILSNPVYNNAYIPITINNFRPIANNVVGSNATLSNVILSNIVWNKNNKFQYEKTLEAYICENIDKRQVGFCNLLGYPNHRIKWFGNYLPYGVAGKNIDLVCEIYSGNDSRILVIELKNDPVSYNGYRTIVDDQLIKYSQFIEEAFKSYRGDNVVVERIVLTHLPLHQLVPSQTQFRNTKWIGYNIDSNRGVVTFSRLL